MGNCLQYIDRDEGMLSDSAVDASTDEPSTDGVATGVVSLRADVPAALLDSMQAFIERHPNWDQYRLVQAALAGYLVQNGSCSREVTRCYLANLFPGQRSFNVRSEAERNPSA